MDVIKLLPDSVANQIAAGEVIQRPASVVKELVENSIDAQATSVLINVKDAGRTLIQIVDNGCGMSTTDARMAFERHATSKIRQATDLLSLHTMGFRGEALPSVAAVSEIDLRSMRRDDDLGTHIIISASKVESQQPEAMVPGTNIMVKRLFFNLPARRKFLKKDTIELSHIVKEFERLALVNTNVEFTLKHNDVLLHKLQPGALKERIVQLFGKTFEHQLLPVSTETSLVKIEGFVCMPENARKRNALQFFFVNGRYMRHPYFHKAVVNCYENLIPGDEQPNYFLNLTVDPESIDVNIHPQKYEIKFENEQAVWQILTAAVKESLGRFNISGALDFDSVDVPDIPAVDPNAPIIPPDEGADPTYNPFRQENYRPHNTVPTDWEKLYEGFANDRAENVQHVRSSVMNNPQSTTFASKEVSQETVAGEMPSIMQLEEDKPKEIMQIANRFIVAPTSGGMLLIDQYRAHTLVLYERYMSMAEQGNVPSQNLIFPDSIELDPAHNATALSISSQLQEMGFSVSNLGNNCWAINAAPSILGKTSPAEALTRVINAVAEEDEDYEKTMWQKIALSVAKSSAVKYGQALTAIEMERLVADLLRLPTPNYTPDGKTVLKTLTVADLTRLL